MSGHSDADVVLHALVDAILGALSDGDIGVHFPPSDPQWRGASSDRFLAFAVERVRARGGRIAHLDITVVCEAPRIGPHRDAMRARIAEIAGMPLARVAVKATTSEKLGFTGRGEGMAAFANATVRLPWSARMINPALTAAARALLDLCRERKLKIATAESCTGGLVAATLTDIPGSSDVVDRGFVTYSNAAKQTMLGVPAATLERYGAVSRETAEAMARGALAHAPVRSRGVDHRHCRTGRRRAGQAGRARAFRRRLAHAAADPSGAAVRRHRPHPGARSVGRGRARHAARVGGDGVTVIPRSGTRQASPSRDHSRSAR